MNCRIFREYDVRGVASDDLTGECISKLGLGFGTLALTKGVRAVALGCDNRVTSPTIHKCMKNALIATGLNVVDFGEITSPGLLFGMQRLQLDAAVMVTGSHNPPEYNGVKFQIRNTPLYGAELRELIPIIDKGAFRVGRGSVRTIDITKDYIAMLSKDVSLSRSVRVVLDCGNGSACRFAPELLSELGCEVTAIFCNSDGRFPNHNPDPAVRGNLAILQQQVQRINADVGIAFDGDGNRIGIVDDSGRILPADIILGILASDLMNKGRPITVVCEVKCSLALINYVRSCGGRTVMTRVGYPFLLGEMFSQNAAIAGELTGHICYNHQWFSFGDALYVAVRLVELLSRTGDKLSRLTSVFPRYLSTPELRIQCPYDTRVKVVERIRHHYERLWPCLVLDGVRVCFDENSWVLIRASNTEPVISIRMEAQTKSRLNEVAREIDARLRAEGIIFEWDGNASWSI